MPDSPWVELFFYKHLFTVKEHTGQLLSRLNSHKLSFGHSLFLILH